MTMVLFGWEKDSTTVCDDGIIKCDHCNNYATFEI